MKRRAYGHPPTPTHCASTEQAAQQLYQDLGWWRAAAELKRLILAAAADLARTDSATTARAVLW